MQKKQIIWLLGFVLLLFSGDRLTALILKELNAGTEFRYSRLYNGAAQRDIVVVGNSRGVNSFYVPDISEHTGKTAFNLSYNGLTMEVADVLIGDYLERYQKPELILIEVTMMERLNPRLINNFKLYAGQSAGLHGLIKKTSPQEALFAELSHLYRFNCEMFQRSLYYYKSSDDTWVNLYQMHERLINTIEESEVNQLDLDSTLLQALKNIVALANEKEIPVKLVFSPYLPAYLNKLSNVEAWIAKVEAATGLPVYDYSGAVEETQYFADAVHLNLSGSRQLFGLMQADGVFEPTHTAHSKQTR